MVAAAESVWFWTFDHPASGNNITGHHVQYDTSIPEILRLP